MKKIYLPLKAIGILVLVVMMGIRSEGAIKTSFASANWNVASTWFPSGVPASGDEVIIANGHTVTLTSPTTVLNVTINAGGILNVGNIQSLTVTGTFTNNGTLSGTSGRIALKGNFTNSGSFTLTSGRLTISTGNFTNNTGGNFTLGAGRLYLAGGFGNSGTLSLAAEVRLTGSAAQDIGSFTTTGMVSMQKNGGVATFSGNVNGGGLEINGTGGTLNLGVGLTHTFTGTWTRNSGTLNGGSSTINFSAAPVASGTGGTFTPATGTVNFTGAAQTLPALIYNNITLSGSGVKITTGVTVNGILSLEGTATVSTVPTYGLAATLQYNTSTNRTASVEWRSPFVATGGVIIANIGDITMNGGKIFGNNSNVPLTINSGATLITSGSNYALTFHGDFINNGTLTAAASPVTITGTTAAQNIGPFSTTGLVSMTKASGTATLTGNVSGAGLTINGTAGTLNLGTGLIHTFSSTWTRTAGTLNGGSSTINFTKSGTVHSLTGGTFTANTGTVNYAFNAAGSQTVVPSLIYYNLTLSGSSTKTLSNVPTISNNLTISGSISLASTTALSVSGDVILESGTISGGSVIINVGGNWTNNGGTFTPETSTINFNNTTTGKSINGTAVSQTFNIVSLNNSNQTLTAGSNLTISTLTSSATSTLEMGTKTLTIVTTASGNAGTINTQNITSTPFSSGKTWGGTLVFNAAAPQIVVAGTYNNLTISTTGGVTASGNITVNGELNLASANASDNQGCFETTASYALTMGGSAITTGPGDVTGVVTRTSFVSGTPYTFGNQFTTLNFSSGTFPTSLSVKIVLAVVPWTPTTKTINRYYEIIRTGGTDGMIMTMDLHYLDSELNSASENKLVFWDIHSLTTLHEHSRSSYNTTDNWFEMTNVTLAYIAPASTFGATTSKYYSLAEWTTSLNRSIWYGGTSGVWDLSDNWTSSVPTATSNVIIPDATTTDNNPILPASLTLNSLTIQSAGILDGGSSTVTLTGAAGAWLSQGTFNSGSSTLIFTNAAATMSDVPLPIVTYNNITIAANAKLTIETGSYIGIKGAVTLGVSAILDAATNECTIEYNGSAAQTVINPNGPTPGYHSLILNNSSTITLPTDILYIRGDWTNNMIGITATNVEFNGPYSMVHYIKGSQPTSFTTLTINNSTGIALTNVDVTVKTKLYLTNGVITTGNNKLIITATSTAAVSRTNGWVNGNLQKTITRNVSSVFETGTSVYAPATIFASGGTGTIKMTAKATNGNLVAGSGINQSAKCNHFWTVANSGTGTFSYYNLYLEFTNTANAGITNNYSARKYSTNWENVYGFVIPEGSTTITINSLNTFGDFEVGEPNSLEVTTQPYNMAVCSGDNASFSAISTSEPTTSIYWERSIDGGDNFEIIDGVIDDGVYSDFESNTLNITAAPFLINSYLYQAILTNLNGSITSDQATLIVSPTSVGGTLGVGTAVCAGASTTLTLALGSYTGSITKWQLTNDGTTWTDIANTTASYLAENITATTTYRAVVQSGTCSSANSTEQTITVTANSWTGATSNAWEIPGNWSCGLVPTAGTNVTIPTSKTVVITSSSASSPAQCNTLTIEAGGVLMINAGKALTVNGNLTNNAGLTGLVINSDENGTGSLIENSGATATVKRYIANDFKWHFLSSPVSSQEIWPQFAPDPAVVPWGSGSYGWDFYYYNPNVPLTGLYWVNLRKTDGTYNSASIDAANDLAGFGPATPTFDVGKGYLVAYDNSKFTTAHTFSGSLNAGSIGRSIVNSSTPYNLVGNPYPSSIDWKSAEWGTGRDALVNNSGYDYWIWNEDPLVNNYAVFNSSGSASVNGASQYIAPGQAFFVKAASNGSLGMNDGIRAHSTQAFLKNSDAEPNLVRLKITSDANTYSDEMIVEFNADFSGGGSDKFWSFYTVAPEIYSVKDGNNYSIDRYNTLTDDMKVDIAAKTGVTATYTITATNIADFTLRDKVYLLDKKTGVKTNLKQTPSYSFAGTPDDERNRFQLIFGTSIGTDEETASDFTIYASDNIIYIRNDKANEPYTVMVSNMLGQIITRTQLAGNTLNQIELKRVPGVYVVTVYSEGKLYSRKVVVK